MKRSLRKLIPTFVMLVITAALLGTSTFAWFSMNNKVTVTGMEVKTRVSSNITIAPFNAGDATSEGNADTNYVNSLGQTRTGVLEPVSTINGINYFYTATSNVDADGDAIDEEYVAYNEATALAVAEAGKTNYDADFQTNYGVETPISASNVVYGYIDYVFYLKAMNTDAAARKVYMDKCNLLYTGVTTTVKAWRVGMFVQKVNEDAKASAIASTDLVTILTPASAANQDAGKAVNSTTTIATLAYGEAGGITTYNPAANVDINLASGTTQRYKITIRLWLEGEDTECTNDTFATLNADWRLDLGFTIGESTGVTGIGSTAAVAVTGADTDTATITLSNTDTGTIENGETAKSFAWKNAADGSAAAGTNNEYTYTASADGDFYCLVTTTKGNVYRSPTVTLDVA